VLDRSDLSSASGLHHGAYVLWESGGPLELLLVATGSEVAVTLEAGRRLAEEEGGGVRVVSMPSWELFEEQPQEYRESVLPPEVTARLSVEAASPQGWREWVGPLGDTVAVTTFGHSASGSRVLKEYGFNVDNIMTRARSVLERSRKVAVS
jgi:transketolase